MYHSTPAAPACEDNAPLYHFAALGRLANAPAFVREIKQVFLQDTPARLAGLEAAIAAANWGLVAREAHSLKSMMGLLGLRQSMHLLRQMEQAADSRPAQQHMPIWLRSLRLSVAPVLLALHNELRAGSCAASQLEPA
ncbi:Hpt domain-containing protein [Hymenobacter yonginensis]|uniref:Hpt domain-containing protein n=1 Tax=Hymenobacter yonginensis TaxID=748197 RepID=A0ABY7PUU8_9BACT|nr:Hpt domain-containing protein [Hymenobacter yonginensis]WBO86691.1 Hpt domain-containing protein [Hymenobacter yonginensis]